MRDFIANDRIIPSELRGALVDAPERATYVVTDTNPTSPTDLEVGCDAGTVVVDGNEVSVSAQTESVSDISGQVTETAYRYHTLSVDATGALVVRSSPVGEFDASDPDTEPITQVTEPSHDTGEVFLGTAFQVGAAIERVFDGRYVLDGVPTTVLTDNTIGVGGGANIDSTTEESALGASTTVSVSPQGKGSGLDADLVRGGAPVETVNGDVGDVTVTAVGAITSDSINESFDVSGVTDVAVSYGVDVGITNVFDVSYSVSGDQHQTGTLDLYLELLDPDNRVLAQEAIVTDVQDTFSRSATLPFTAAGVSDGQGAVRIRGEGSNYDIDGSLSASIDSRGITTT